jgi:cold shock CspA family protein
MRRPRTALSVLTAARPRNQDACKEVFFHSSAIYGEGIGMLREGDGVEFELGDGGSKGPRATSVRRTTT